MVIKDPWIFIQGSYLAMTMTSKKRGEAGTDRPTTLSQFLNFYDSFQFLQFFTVFLYTILTISTILSIFITYHSTILHQHPYIPHNLYNPYALPNTPQLSSPCILRTSSSLFRQSYLSSITISTIKSNIVLTISNIISLFLITLTS